MEEKMDIYYFSGTGNTKMIVNSIAKRLNAENYDITAFPMERGFNASSGSAAKLLFAFPANSQSVSPQVWKFFKSLPDAGGTEFFVVVTLNTSVYIIEPLYKLLRRKGYIPKGNCMLSMPGSMLNGPVDEKQDAQRLAAAMKKSADFADGIVSGKASYDAEHQGSRFVSFLSRCTVLPWFSMRLMFKLETDKEKCSHCGLCAKNCPVGNIRNSEYPMYGNQCEFCMRCAVDCPNKAIHVKGNKNMTIRKPVADMDTTHG